MALVFDRSKVAVDPVRLSLLTRRSSVSYTPYVPFVGRPVAVKAGLAGLGQDYWSGFNGGTYFNPNEPIDTSGVPVDTGGTVDTGGWDWGTIIQGGVQAGETYASNWFQQQVQKYTSTGGTLDIVPMQNAVADQLGLMFNAYNAAKSAGRLTVTVIDSFYSALHSLLNSLCSYRDMLCQKYGTGSSACTRANAGCSYMKTTFWTQPTWDADRARLVAAGGAAGTTGGGYSYTDPVTGQTVTVPGTGGGVLGSLGQYAPWILGGLLLLWKFRR